MLSGNLLEFKLRIGDLNSTLFQSVKYLSARRVKGKPAPANVLLVDLCGEKAYLYHSADYLSDIERVYTGAASKENDGFVAQPPAATYDYSHSTDA